MGLVLGGGGARGISHVGALKAFTEAGASVQYVLHFICIYLYSVLYCLTVLDCNSYISFLKAHNLSYE